MCVCVRVVWFQFPSSTPLRISLFWFSSYVIGCDLIRSHLTQSPTPQNTLAVVGRNPTSFIIAATHRGFEFLSSIFPEETLHFQRAKFISLEEKLLSDRSWNIFLLFGSLWTTFRDTPYPSTATGSTQ